LLTFAPNRRDRTQISRVPGVHSKSKQPVFSEKPDFQVLTHAASPFVHMIATRTGFAPHDAALAHALRSAASAIPQHIAAGRLARAHSAALRVHVLLLVAQAWGYLHTATLAEASHTARHLQALTA
jgi:hypothetical protein